MPAKGMIGIQSTDHDYIDYMNLAKLDRSQAKSQTGTYARVTHTP